MFEADYIVNTEDTIKDLHIDWGTGADQVDAEDMPIKDVAAYFVASTVEAVIAEIHSNTKYLSNGVFSDGGYTDNLDGTITLEDSIATVAPDANELRITRTVIGGTTGTEFPSISTDDVNYIVVKYNSGTPVFDVLDGGDLALIDEIEYVPYLTIVRIGNELTIVEWNETGDNLVNKLHARFVKTDRFARESGFILSEDTGRVVEVTGGTLWNGANKLAFDDFASDVDLLELWYHSGGSWTHSDITQYDNTQYDNGTNLATLTDGKYALNWCYRSAGDPKVVRIVLGEGDYSLSQARASAEPTGLPDIITTVSMLVGRIIVLKNASTASLIDNPYGEYSLYPYTVHGELDGLDDDDHLQYILHSGTRAMTGDFDLGSTNDIINTKDIYLVNGTPTIYLGVAKGTVSHSGTDLVITAVDGNISLEAEAGHQIDVRRPLDMNSLNILGLAYPTLDEHAVSLEYIHTYYDFLGDPTGFIDAPNEVQIDITGDTFTIEPQGASFSYLKVGRLTTVSAPQTKDLSGYSKGDLIYIYYNASNVLTTTLTPWGFNLGFVFVATSYVFEVAAAPGVSYYTVNNELHGARMDDATHHYLHDSVGTRFVSGFAATFYPATNTYDLGDGEIYDEDLPHLTTGASPFAGGNIAFRDAALHWTTDGITGDFYREDGVTPGQGNPYYDNAGTPTVSSNNYYTIWWIFAVNGYTIKIASFMGQAQYFTLAGAQAASLDGDMLFGTLPMTESKILYKVIIQNKSTNLLSDVQDYRYNVSLPGTSPTLTSHSSLSGLGSDDHAQYLLADGTRPLTAAWSINEGLTGLTDVIWDTSYTHAGHTTGHMYWDSDNATVAIDMLGSDVRLQIGAETLARVYNAGSGAITNGTAVSAIGQVAGNYAVMRTDVTNPALSFGFVGLATEDIAEAATGYVTIYGSVRDFATDHLAAGSLVYVDPAAAGTLTDVRPTAPDVAIAVGLCAVSDPTVGLVGVLSTLQPNVEMLSDILINGSKTGGEILIWDVGNLRYEVREILEADISDMASYLLLDGTTPMTGNLLMGNNLAMSWRDFGDANWEEVIKMDGNDDVRITHPTGKKIILESVEVTGDIAALGDITLTGASTVAGIVNTDLVDKSDAETITGLWTHNANIDIAKNSDITWGGTQVLTMTGGNIVYLTYPDANYLLIGKAGGGNNMKIASTLVDFYTNVAFASNTYTLSFASQTTTFNGIQVQNLLDKSAVETVTGEWSHDANLNILDGKKLMVGTGDDLQIYHDGAQSHIINNTSNLNLSSANFVFDTTGSIFVRDSDDSDITLLQLDTSARTFKVGASADPIVTTLYGDLAMSANIITDVSILSVTAGHGNGLRFWNNDDHKIYMSAQTESGAGRLDDTSDYNIYHRTSAGTNRGFQFQNDTSTPYFAINPDAIRSSVDIDILSGDLSISNEGGSTHTRLDFWNANSAPSSYRCIFQASQARGTLASPTALMDGDQLFSIVSNGHGTTAYRTVAEIAMSATGNFTDSSTPTQIKFRTTSVGESNRSDALIIGPDHSATLYGDLIFNTVSLTVAGIQNQNLVDKTAYETITKEWIFDEGLIITSGSGDFDANPRVNTFTSNQIDGTDSDWVNSDSGSCLSTLQATVTHNGVAVNRVLQQDDVDSNRCQLHIDNQSGVYFSGFISTTNMAKYVHATFYKQIGGSAFVGGINIDDSSFKWYSDPAVNLFTPSNDTWYYYHCYFDSVDTVQITVYEMTTSGPILKYEGEQDTYTSGAGLLIDQVGWVTFNADSGYVGWYGANYWGNNEIDSWSNLYDGTAWSTVMGGFLKTETLYAGSLMLGTPLSDGNIASASTWTAKQDALTFGIANTNAVKIDSASVNSGEYARFTANGLESRTINEIEGDISFPDLQQSGKLWGSHEGIGYFVIEDSSYDYVLFKDVIPDGSKVYYVKFLASWDVSPASSGAIDSYYGVVDAGDPMVVKPTTNNDELTTTDLAAGLLFVIYVSIPADFSTGDLLTVVLDANGEDIGGENLKIHAAYMVEE